MSKIVEFDADLAAALLTVQDATAHDGPRFTPFTCKALVRMVLCRAFGKPMLELAYLVAIASACGRRPGRYEAFFWNEQPALAGAFRAYLFTLRERGDLASGMLSLATDNIAIATDGDAFAVQFTRMPLLVALAEFLMTTIGYPEFDAAVAPLTSGPVTQRAVSDVANSLSRALHAYLQNRLDSGHTQRKMQVMLDHLSARGRADAASIDDEAILSFWLAWSAGEEIEGVRTFRGAATGFLHLRAALTAAQDRTRLDQARSIGADREAGEVDPGAVESALAEMSEENDLVAALTAAPLDSVKFCNQRELVQLETVALYGRHGATFVRTALRHDVFGDVQARITQALRRNAPWRQEPGDTYEGQVGDYRRLLDQVDRVLWASLHVLIELESAAVIDLLQALRPDLDLSGMIPSADEPLENVVQLHVVSPVRRFLRLLRCQPDELGPELAELTATARRAFGKIARKGFTASDLAEPPVAGAFRAAPPVLRKLHDLLSRFVRLVAARSDLDMTRAFEDDRTVFYDQFERLYGET